MSTVLRVRPSRVVRSVFFGWLAIELVLVVADSVIRYAHLTPLGKIGNFRQMANIAREDGLATWFSSTQLLLCGMLLALLAWVAGSAGQSWKRRAWAAIALFFTYMAFDDGAKFHERAASGFKRLFKPEAMEYEDVLGFFPSYSWQIVFGPLFMGMGLFTLWFLWRELQNRSRRLLILAAFACYGLAVGLDFIEGLEYGYDAVAQRLGVTTRFTEHYGRVIEEFLEMLGTTFFLTTFLAQLITQGDLRVEYAEPSARTPSPSSPAP